MKIKAFILILCMLLLVSCTEAIEFTDTEDDYYGITENIEKNAYDVTKGVEKVPNITEEMNLNDILENIEEYDEQYDEEEVTGPTYLLNTNSKKIHYMHCGTGQRTKEKNRDYFTGDVSYLLGKGYTTCKNCFE